MSDAFDHPEQPKQPSRGIDVPRGLGLLVAAMLTFGCPEERGQAPPARCTELYAQCQLPDGPLGVCSDVPCPPGKQAPCLACVSQH